MLLIRSALVLFAVCVAVPARTGQVQTKEAMLAAAGFKVVPTNTPQRQASLGTPPPHKFVRQVRDNVVLYTYADPTICDCLYVGNQVVYDRYRQNVIVQTKLDEQLLLATANQMDWSPRGPAWAF
jgi:hypothetical protein